MKDDDLIILDGCTFFYSSATGDLETGNSQGLFYMDVRHLSRWLLRVDGEELEPLSSRGVDYYSARVVGMRAGADSDGPRLAVRRDRFVTEGAHEDIVIANLTDEKQDVTVELRYESDFADTLEVQQGGNAEGRFEEKTHPRSVELWNERDGYERGTVLTFNRRGRISKHKAVFEVGLGPRERWSLCVDMTPVVDGRRRPPLLRCGAFHHDAPKMPMTLDEWLETAPELDTDDKPLLRTYRQSLLDIAALRVRPDGVTMKWAMPGGGVPWFMTVFGRDSLLTAYQALPFHQELARATLEALAEMQATEWDNWRDAEPGKILHELRRGTLAATGQIPHSPYYGAHDTTPLFLIVLDEYERWSGDVEFVRRLEPNARAALAWLEGPADLDGDGYIEFRQRSTAETALRNHCWRDSDNAILFADGSKAQPPIAMAEHQGLAYDARLRMARLLREVLDDEENADRLNAEAEALKRRFNRDFWSSSRRYFALGLDGNKEQIDALTSDLGHLLWSGIVEDRNAPETVERLRGTDIDSGWGIRSMSSRMAGYNPLAYHGGTVWPHDTAIVGEGMRRYGYREEASYVGRALLDAAAAFTNQLPEVFAGFARDATDMPIEYPEALKPQSWAAGAPLLVLRTLLGVDVVGDEVRASPCLPPGMTFLHLRKLGARGRHFDL